MRLLPIAAGCLLFLSTAVFSELKGLQFRPIQFDENSYVIRFQSSTMKQLEPVPRESQSYDFAFQDLESRFEIRYTLFAQVGDIEDYRLQVALWAMIVVQNITGDDSSPGNTSAFDDEDVKGEFNADFGLTNFSFGGATDFTEGYQYVMINFYYRTNLGIMCQSILFNDIEWVKTDEFNRLFHSFNFYD